MTDGQSLWRWYPEFEAVRLRSCCIDMPWHRCFCFGVSIVVVVAHTNIPYCSSIGDITSNQRNAIQRHASWGYALARKQSSGRFVTDDAIESRRYPTASCRYNRVSKASQFFTPVLRPTYCLSQLRMPPALLRRLRSSRTMILRICSHYHRQTVGSHTVNDSL